MTPVARSCIVGATLLALSVSSGCGPGVQARNITATMAEMHGQYEVWSYAEGWAGEAHYLTVELVASDSLWDQRRLCPVWTEVAMTANGREMELRQAGGVGYQDHDYCAIGFYVLPVDATEWDGESEVRFRLEDATGSDEIVFQNFVSAPRVVLESPANGVLHVGDSLTLRFEPSLYVLPSLLVVQGTFGSGVAWAQGYVDDIKTDDQRVSFVVPDTAHVPSTEALHFYSGSGWWGPVVDCSAATSCFAKRSSCPEDGCAQPTGLHYTSLDDNTVTVPVSVVP